VGATLVCDPGYRIASGRCVPVPANTHGHYLGTTLICSFGYRIAGGRCGAATFAGSDAANQLASFYCDEGRLDSNRPANRAFLAAGGAPRGARNVLERRETARMTRLSMGQKRWECP
jgi:hypothetical protein